MPVTITGVPAGFDDVVALVLVAVEQVKNLRPDAVAASQEQQRIAKLRIVDYDFHNHQNTKMKTFQWVWR